jgi:uncharacterized YccA/Bax inhibitor family protein
MGTTMASQMLNEATFASGAPALERPAAGAAAMSLRGTIVKSLILLLVALVFGAIGWARAVDWFADSRSIWWLIGYVVLIGLTIAAASNPSLALPAGLAYSVLMGLWMGAISRVYEFVFSGIVAQALLASVCVFFACMVLYLSRAIRVTPQLARVTFIAMAGIALLYLIGWILSRFGVNMVFISQPTALGIAISIAICLVAALNLLLDFSFIEQGIRSGAPAAMEWYAAFGLLSTLVWLYAEVLRLLALIRARSARR